MPCQYNTAKLKQWEYRLQLRAVKCSACILPHFLVPSHSAMNQGFSIEIYLSCYRYLFSRAIRQQRCFKDSEWWPSSTSIFEKLPFQSWEIFQHDGINENSITFDQMRKTQSETSKIYPPILLSWHLKYISFLSVSPIRIVDIYLFRCCLQSNASLFCRSLPID